MLEEDRRPPGVVRQLVEYENEPGETVRGYLITPDHLDEKRPGVVVLHPTVPDTLPQARRPQRAVEQRPLRPAAAADGGG